MKQWIGFIAVALMISSLSPFARDGLYAAEGKTPARSGSGPNEAGGPTACVKTAILKKGTIAEHIVVYGSVIAAPGAVQALSEPFECQVISVMVNEGQKVSRGEILLKIQPSPKTMLQFDQAKSAYELARQSYQQMENRHKLKLATNDQLLKAKQTLDQAKLNLESMKHRGIGGEISIPSRVGGLIKKIYVQEGSMVTAGNPIMDIVAQNRIEALLGVEVEDIERVGTGQPVSLTRVNAPASPEIAGKVRQISYAVNPTTRLVDIFVTLTSPADFLLGEYIEGKIAATASEGLIVPRSAVLPEGDHHVLFTVKDGRAVKHTVEIGVENAQAYQVSGKDLRGGEQVVILGNYELTDGMKVETGSCK